MHEKNLFLRNSRQKKLPVFDAYRKKIETYSSPLLCGCYVIKCIIFQICLVLPPLPLVFLCLHMHARMCTYVWLLVAMIFKEQLNENTQPMRTVLIICPSTLYT